MSGEASSRAEPIGSGGNGSDGGIARTARVLGTRRYRQARRRLEAIRARTDDPVAPALDRVTPALHLSELFEYRRKRISVAYLLWLGTGLLGGHRFYLDREGTAAAQFFTGGGLMIWWAVDAFLIPSMVREYNREEAEREEQGRPPRTLDFLETAVEEVSTGEGDEGPAEAVPGWAEGRAAGRGRLAADLAVVAFAGLALGAVSASTGAWRGAAAVVAVVLVIGLAPELSALRRVPGIGDLLRWAGRLGLFYRYHDPGGPVSRAARPVAGLFYAPFRSRARAETHLWVELGGAFGIAFFLVDLAVYGASGLAAGGELFELGELLELSTGWGVAALMTMINVYAFASPVGATLYEYVLAGRSHRRVWLLGGTALAALGLGLAVT